MRKTLSVCSIIRKPHFHGYPLMLVGYMRVSSDSDRQSTDLQRDALLAAGIDSRHLFEDHASGANYWLRVFQPDRICLSSSKNAHF